MSEEDIFHEALARNRPEERTAYLDQACAGDPALRTAVEALLRANVGASGFLDQRAELVGATLDETIHERPGTVIGPYKLLQQIGEGGMGTVYMAEQTHPVHRKVALKVLKPGMDSRQVIARFEAERQALAMMDHVNIARVFDGGTIECSPLAPREAGLPLAEREGYSGRPYFVMELVHGVPITKYCDDNHLTPRERLELFVPVCQAIQHAHQKGIIHRDIKPSNVMVTLYDGKPVPKVIDFGVAKAIEQKLTEHTLFTQYGTMVGTLEYMSPEQAEMSALGVDTRSDIYSLGVLLYELLTGSTPLTHKRLKEAAYAEILRLIKEEEPPRPSTRLTDSGEALASISAQRKTEPAQLSKLLRGELDWIVMKTLEKDRNRRYETASGFAADVQRYLNDEPVQACPPSAAYRFRKMVRRNKTLITTIGVVSVALVLGTAVSVWQAVRATGAEREMGKQRDAATVAEGQATESAAKADAERSAAEQARKAAVANLQKAREAVDQMLTEVGAVDLALVPQMEPVRRALLEKALKFYQGFLDEQGSDRSTRHGTGAAYRRMGWIHRELGQHREAEKAQREGVSLFEGLVAEFPEVPDYRANLADTGGNLADTLLHLGQPREAEKLSRQANEIWRRLLAEFPEKQAYFRPQVIAANRLGGVLVHLGRLPEAEEAFRQSLPLLEKLGDDPARSELTQAEISISAGRPREAEQHFRQALALLEKQVAASPQNPLLRRNVAATQLRLGVLLRTAGERQEAEKLVRQSIAHTSQLVTDYPRTAQYRGILAEAYEHLFALLVANRQLEEAEQVYRQSLPHVEKLIAEAPERRWYWEILLAHFRRYADMLSTAGRPQEAEQAYGQAVATGRKMLSKFPDESRVLHVVAYTYRVWGTWLQKAGRLPEAEQVFREALDKWQKLSETHPRLKGDLENIRTTDLEGLVRVLSQGGQNRKAAEVHEQLLKIKPDSAIACNNVAWFLATCPDQELRKPDRAVELARKAVELAPKEGNYWNTLGVAQYRAGSWQDACATLDKSMGLRNGGDAFDWFFLAMAHRQLGARDEARKWFDQGIQWLEKNAPQNEELRGFRAEAEELLGIKK